MIELKDVKNERAMRELVNKIVESEKDYIGGRIEYYQKEHDELEAMLSKIRMYEPEFIDPKREGRLDYYVDAVKTLTAFREAFMGEMLKLMLDMFS